MNWLRKIGFIDFLVKTFGPDGIFSSGAEGHAFLIGGSQAYESRLEGPKSCYANGIVKNKAIYGLAKVKVTVRSHNRIRETANQTMPVLLDFSLMSR